MYFIVHKTAVIQMNYVTKYTQKLCRWDYSFSPFLKEIQSIIFKYVFLTEVWFFNVCYGPFFSVYSNTEDSTS